MNRWAEAGIPFIFIIDFEIVKPLIFKLDEIDPSILLFSINGITNCSSDTRPSKRLYLVKHPEKYSEYLKKFKKVKNEIASGNTYLLNLTSRSPIEMNYTLKEVFHCSNARYKIWFNDEFVCFSPEIFIRISEGRIRSFPMKGTINADIPRARDIILRDKKETAEHYTIVDLIRNDLNSVSKNVCVERFRYVDILETNNKRLLQVSSEICGDLGDDYLSRIGEIVFSLLPAGSVSGAPKQRTTEIISSVENRTRGYFTGICGVFDGCNLDSCVMIRYIERDESGYFYQSGGGITSFSDPRSEYNEMIDKIYVPFI